MKGGPAGGGRRAALGGEDSSRETSLRVDLSAFGALNQSRSVRYNDKPPATRGAQRDSSEDRIDDVRDQVRRGVDHIDDIVTVDVAEVRIEIELIPKRQWDVRV